MPSSSHWFFFIALGLALAAGCGTSKTVPPEIVQTVADQAAKVATLEVQLRDAKKSLDAASSELEKTKAQLAASEDAQHRLQELMRRTEESNKQDSRDTNALKRELQDALVKLRAAQSQLNAVEAERTQRADRMKVVGTWHHTFDRSVDSPVFEFRDDGSGVFSGSESISELDYQFRFAETAEPGVYQLQGRLQKDGSPITGTFRVNADGTEAVVEGWRQKKPLKLVRSVEGVKSKSRRVIVLDP